MAHSTADIKTVESWHLGQGYNAIGYNYWVGDGTLRQRVKPRRTYVRSQRYNYRHRISR